MSSRCSLWRSGLNRGARLSDCPRAARQLKDELILFKTYYTLTNFSYAQSYAHPFILSRDTFGSTLYLRSSYPFADIHYPRECLLDIFEGTEVQYNVRVAVYVVRVRVLVYCSTKVAVCTCAVSYHSIYTLQYVYSCTTLYEGTFVHVHVHVHVHVQYTYTYTYSTKYWYYGSTLKIYFRKYYFRKYTYSTCTVCRATCTRTRVARP